MNPCGTSGDQQPGGISWASDNWEHPSGVICNFQDFGGHFQTTRPADQWEWDNAMVFPLINQTANSSHHGNNIEQKPTIFASSPGTDSRHFSGSLPFPSYSNFFPQNTPLNVWNQMGSVHNFGNFESIQNIHPTDQFFHSEQLGSGIPGLAATNAMTNIRSFDQRRHFLNIMDFEQKNIGELFPGRIGLNLAMGGRTYFSAEDSAAARLAKRPRSSSPAHVQMPMCQAEGCTADLSRSKHYHRRHKVCEFHSKAPSVMANAQTQRFCQQCSRFHVLSEFDEAKRSCRKRLADHNRRRRKPQPSTIISDENPLARQSFALKSEEHNLLQSSKLITADATSMIQLHLKKTSSPSASTEDQLNDQRSSSSPLIDFPLINASSSCFGRSGDEKPSVSKHSFLGSNNSTGITQTSDSHELLIHNAAQNYESIPMHHGHERSLMFQHYLQEIASTGPNLSLSTMSGDLGMDTRAGLRLSTHYNEENNIAASWRKPEAGILAHDFPAQSLMRPRSSLECMRGSISYQEQGQERLRSSTSSSSFQGVIEGHSILSLSKTSPCREAGVRVHQSTLQQSAVALEFQEQQFDDADDVMEIQLQPVKFSDLQSLRPFGSCVYD